MPRIRVLIFTCSLVVFAGHVTAQPQHFEAAIETLAQKLQTSYVIPEVGARYAAMLRQELVRGAYRDLRDATGAARRLTADLQAVAEDGHLRVEPEANAHFGPGGLGARRGPPGAARLKALSNARWIAPGVAYVCFNEFPGDPATVAATDRFMLQHASAKALIIDARTHRGGGMREMSVMLPYLYASETLLVAMDVAQSIVHERGAPPDEGPSVRPATGPVGRLRRQHFAIPHPTERRLFDVQVYYLTSQRTASAAEHLAFALQRTHRAVLIGEATAGANHFGGFESIGEALMAFIPVGRTLDPMTGRDWERTGVQPDIAVPANRALDEALRLARRDAR